MVKAVMVPVAYLVRVVAALGLLRAVEAAGVVVEAMEALLSVLVETVRLAGRMVAAAVE